MEDTIDNMKRVIYIDDFDKTEGIIKKIEEYYNKYLLYGIYKIVIEKVEYDSRKGIYIEFEHYHKDDIVYVDKLRKSVNELVDYLG